MTGWARDPEASAPLERRQILYLDLSQFWEVQGLEGDSPGSARWEQVPQLGSELSLKAIPL